MRLVWRRVLSVALCLLMGIQCANGLLVTAGAEGMQSQGPVMGSGDVLGAYIYRNEEAGIPDMAQVTIGQLDDEELQAKTKEFVEQSGLGEISFMDLWQITLTDNGEPVSLAANVTVDVFYIDERDVLHVQETETVHLLRISDDGVSSLEYTVSESWQDENGATCIRTVTFEDDCAAVYALVKTGTAVPPAAAGEAEAVADGCTIQAAFGEDSGFPEDAQLSAERVSPGGEAFRTYFDAARNAQGGASLVHADFYDVFFQVDGVETEPAEGAWVDMTLTFEEGFLMAPGQNLYVIHYLDDGGYELIEPTILQQQAGENADILVTQIGFRQSSFSVIGIIVFDKGVVTALNVEGEFFTSVTSKKITKIWKTWDGQDETALHDGDTVTVVLEEVEETVDEEMQFREVQRIVLSAQTNWQGEFTDLDPAKTYRMVEKEVTTDDADGKDTYRSELDSGVRWLETWTEEPLQDGCYYILMDVDTNRKLRASSTNITDAVIGNYTVMRYTSNSISIRSYSLLNRVGLYSTFEATQTAEGQWLLRNIGNQLYLTLICDAEGVYHWVNTQAKLEGSYLTVENGKISATVNGVTRWLQFPVSDTSGSESFENEEDSPSLLFYKYTLGTQQVDATLVNRRNYTPEELAFSVTADVKKTIDYLGDVIENPDTDADELETVVLWDLYRLYLDFIPRTDATGLDLVLVLDVSSSMNTQDIVTEDGNITRGQALLNALDVFIPEFLGDSNNRNRLSIVVFENESMIIMDWTQDADAAIASIHQENLMKGTGTNYEAGLMRAHEAFANRGTSTNKKAMIFLSDGEPGNYVVGNDKEEPGNVTVSLGDSITIGTNGPQGKFTYGLYVGSGMEQDVQSYDAITSFRRHNPDTVIGTIAFRTNVSDYMVNLATDPNYVLSIYNGGLEELLGAMKLITDFVPSGICVTDVLSENVGIYEDDPDYRATMTDTYGNMTVLYENGTLTAAGGLALDNAAPIVYDDQNRTVTMTFHPDYEPEDDCTYTLSFNIQPNQQAYNRYADECGVYPNVGQNGTDYAGNTTSTGKGGFYSNGEQTSVRWSFHEVEQTQYYPKPVIQVRSGTLTIRKVDFETGQIGLSGAKFELYREADSDRENGVTLEGLTGSFVKVGEGVTDENGLLTMGNLRLRVFDAGYHYYLVETEAPVGYSRLLDPVGLTLYTDSVVLDSDAGSLIGVADSGAGVVVKNESSVLFNLTKVAAEDMDRVLPGAEFAVYRLRCTDPDHDHSGILDPDTAEPNCWRLYGEQTSGEDGKLSFELPIGSTYRLVETKAPGGYVLPKGQWSVTVGRDKSITIAAVAAADGSLPPAFSANPDGGYCVMNVKPRQIPTTGGSGAVVFSMIGVTMIATGLSLCLWGFKRRKYFQEAN